MKVTYKYKIYVCNLLYKLLRVLNKNILNLKLLILIHASPQYIPMPSFSSLYHNTLNTLNMCLLYDLLCLQYLSEIGPPINLVKIFKFFYYILICSNNQIHSLAHYYIKDKLFQKTNEYYYEKRERRNQKCSTSCVFPTYSITFTNNQGINA